MKRIIFLLLLLPSLAFAVPFYFTATISPPLNGGTPAGYNMYIDDCAPGAPVGAPAEVVQSGVETSGIDLASGVYEICFRAFNIAGEQSEPGFKDSETLTHVEIPGVIEGFTITIRCDPGNYCTNATVITPVP